MTDTRTCYRSPLASAGNAASQHLKRREFAGRIPLRIRASLLAAISIVAKIAVAVAVPAVIMIKTATIAIPIAFEEASAFVAGPYPAGAGVRGAGPISVVPLVSASYRVPIPFDPNVTGTGSA